MPRGRNSIMAATILCGSECSQYRICTTWTPLSGTCHLSSIMDGVLSCVQAPQAKAAAQSGKVGQREMPSSPPSGLIIHNLRIDSSEPESEVAIFFLSLPSRDKCHRQNISQAFCGAHGGELRGDLGGDSGRKAKRPCHRQFCVPPLPLELGG